MKYVNLFIVLMVLFDSIGFAQEPPAYPILRIETRMHTSPIKKISVDHEERLLVTGSEDKTIRVWELKTGRLLNVLRPPIGEGEEGKIYTVALSPDGKHLAAGGWTGYEWDKSHCVYIFELTTGKILNRISGFANVVNTLLYSPKGHYLVAGGAKDGVRFYRVPGYTLWKEDTDYGNQIYGMDFSPHGTLYTTCWDGYIRSYDANFTLQKKQKAPGEHFLPMGIAVSPDGSKLAVGYFDSPTVSILSASSLELLHEAATDGVEGNNFSNVTWSRNGEYLYGAGGCFIEVEEGYKNIIRRWDSGGSGTPLDIPAARNTIFQLYPLKNNGLVFASAEPSFGIVDSSGQITLYAGNDKADFRGQQGKLLVSQEGFVVKFGYEQWGEAPAIVDVKERLLNPAVNREYKDLYPPIIEMRGLEITDWEDSYEPKLNGNLLPLKQYEPSRSLAIAPDGRQFLLGTEWYLRCFDRRGQELWNVPANGSIWAVNIAETGKVAVAACGDGTLRWYRMQDGKELLSFFPHSDRKRWILWTPKGFYDSSPGSEEFLGWHLNKGKGQAADYFPASRFRDRFYRPDIIDKICITYDETQAITLANAESGKTDSSASVTDILPPVITILSPQDGTTVSKNQLTVRYAVRNPSQDPVIAIKVLIDGRPISQQRGLNIKARTEGTGELNVLLPERDFELSLIAETSQTASAPATIRLFWPGKKDEFQVKPKLYILAVGVSRYKKESLRLQYARKDAEDFVRMFLSQKGRLYEDVVVKLLLDEGATKDEILDGLEWLQRQTTSKDVAMIFLAGHGMNDPTGIYYYLPQNADPERLKRTGLPFSDIKTTVSSLAGKVVLFVDTCHSGNVMGRRSSTDITAVINDLTSAENGVVVFASSTGRQYSLEDPSWGNGAFTKALLEGLEGKADLLGKGKITVNMLDAFMAERVKELTQGKQTPVTTKPATVPDFPVAVR